LVQFSLSAGGSPKETLAKIEEQATAIGTATPAAAKAATLAAKGVSKYLGTLGPTESVSVSVTFGITHTPKVEKEAVPSTA
jgi:molybdenum cofactor biosynthesis enzyme